MSISQLILGLNRPQYVASPELLLVALAHATAELDDEPDVARIYKNDREGSTKLTYASLYPRGDDTELLERWAHALREAGGMTSGAGPEVMARAVTDSILATRAAKAKGQAAIPMGPHTATLQDVPGMMGAPRPPNYSTILEQLYVLGGGVRPSVAARWEAAAAQRVATDPLVGAIDRASGELLPGRRDASEPPQVEDVPEWFKRHAACTPMGWFVENWDRLTSPPWVEALPARRWVDWATTVLRLAIGFGYLWEARWFDRLAVLVLGGELTDESLADGVDSRGQLMAWADAGQQPSVRDVHRSSRALVLRGMRARDFFESVELEGQTGDILALLRNLSADQQARQRLQECLQARPARKHNNVWETVRYALASREGTSQHADHYGLLHSRRGGWSVVAPGTEWLAVVASLACEEPQGTSTASTVWSSIRSLGLAPSLGELLRLLEWSGLARESADADQAVLVSSAF